MALFNKGKKEQEMVELAKMESAMGQTSPGPQEAEAEVQEQQQVQLIGADVATVQLLQAMYKEMKITNSYLTLIKGLLAEINKKA